MNDPQMQCSSMSSIRILLIIWECTHSAFDKSYAICSPHIHRQPEAHVPVLWWHRIQGLKILLEVVQPCDILWPKIDYAPVQTRVAPFATSALVIPSMVPATVIPAAPVTTAHNGCPRIRPASCTGLEVPVAVRVKARRSRIKNIAVVAAAVNDHGGGCGHLAGRLTRSRRGIAACGHDPARATVTNNTTNRIFRWIRMTLPSS